MQTAQSGAVLCSGCADCASVITADTLALCYLGADRHNGFVAAFAENSRRRMEMYIRNRGGKRAYPVSMSFIISRYLKTATFAPNHPLGVVRFLLKLCFRTIMYVRANWEEKQPCANQYLIITLLLG